MYVMTSARPGPTSTIRKLNTTSASAVQTTPSTTSETSASSVGISLGAVNAAGIASSAVASSSVAPIEARASTSGNLRLRIIGAAA